MRYISIYITGLQIHSYPHTADRQDIFINLKDFFFSPKKGQKKVKQSFNLEIDLD